MSDELENVDTNEEAPVEEVAEEKAAEAPEAAEEAGDAPKKKKGKGKLVLLVVVIVVVLLFGGVGVVYATQHDNPQFCNLICHTPMDPYVQSYMDGTSVNAAQADFDGDLGVTIHANSDQDIVCLTCHTDGIDTQIQEGIAWVTGGYNLPLELTLTLKEPEKHQRDAEAMCLQSGCHEGIESLADLKEATSHLKRNVHDSHNGDQNCTNCHQMHEQSVNNCTQCHSDSETPDGWLTYTEQQKQIKESENA